jgi:hypothetical protein
MHDFHGWTSKCGVGGYEARCAPFRDLTARAVGENEMQHGMAFLQTVHDRNRALFRADQIDRAPRAWLSER